MIVMWQSEPEAFMHDAFRELDRILRELSRSLSVYNDFASQLQRSTAAMASIQDSLSRHMQLDRDLFRAASSIAHQARFVELATSNFRDLSFANQRLSELVSNAAITNSALSKVFAEHNALRASLESIVSRAPITHLLTSLDTTRLLHTSLTSQFRLLNLEAHSFGRLIGASNTLANDLTATFSKLTRSYRDVIESVPRLPELQVPFVAKYSPIEYSLELDVLDRISIEEKEEVDAGGLPAVDEELAGFDDQLLTLINGARASLRSDNPDRARHVTTSMRELFTQILHGLAPDDEVRKWSADPDHYHDNRPTRRARLLYICRKFSCDPLSKFVEDDVRAALTLVESLNAGTHVVQSKLNEFQLQAIVYRMEALAVFLLKISSGG
jgi:hypothetical protein